MLFCAFYYIGNAAYFQYAVMMNLSCKEVHTLFSRVHILPSNICPATVTAIALLHFATAKRDFLNLLDFGV